MKTDDDQQSKTRQEDVHEDPEEEKQKQKNQDHSSQKAEKEAGRQRNVRLSIQAIFFLCDGHRLVEDCVLEHVPLDGQRRAGEETGRKRGQNTSLLSIGGVKQSSISFSLRCFPDTRALTALSL